MAVVQSSHLRMELNLFNTCAIYTLLLYLCGNHTSFLPAPDIDLRCGQLVLLSLVFE